MPALLDKLYFWSALLIPLWWRWQWDYVGRARWYFEYMWELEQERLPPHRRDRVIAASRLEQGVCPYPLNKHYFAVNCIAAGDCVCNHSPFPTGEGR